MKTENINAMLHYIEKSGISTDNITSGYYKDNNIFLKRENRNKNTYLINTISARLDINENIVIVKDENTYEYISLDNKSNSYIFNLQTLITHKVLNKKLSISVISISQKVKDKKDIIRFDSVSDFNDKSKLKVLENKVNKLVTDEVNYDIPDDYIITDGIPESDKVKVLK